jgi:hypothetical protein
MAAALCNAMRTTLVGARPPIPIMSPNSSVYALQPELPVRSLPDPRITAAFLPVSLTISHSGCGARTNPTPPPSTAAPLGMLGVVDTVLLLLHGDLGGSAHLDHVHPTRQLSNTFLQFFFVVLGGGLVQFRSPLNGAWGGGLAAGGWGPARAADRRLSRRCAYPWSQHHHRRRAAHASALP